MRSQGALALDLRQPPFDGDGVDVGVLARELAGVEAKVIKALPKPFSGMSGAAAMRAWLEDLRQREPSIETRCDVPDPYLQLVFAALCTRYGIEPYRVPKQPLTEMCVRAPRTFVRKALWPAFEPMGERVSAEMMSAIAETMAAWGAPVPAESEEEG